MMEIEDNHKELEQLSKKYKKVLQLKTDYYIL